MLIINVINNQTSYIFFLISVPFAKCIAIDPKWAKGHLRLASAYIAQGGHSNDACQELQRVISLDKNNKVAREMLIKELRRRDCGTDSRTGGDPSANATCEPAEQSSDQNSTTSATQPSTNASTTNGQSATNNPPNNVDIDDILHAQDAPHTLSEKFQQYLTRAISWYHSQSDDKKTLLKVSFFFVLLYLALGGRFGMEYAMGQKKRGNYGKGNVYERYRQPERASSYGQESYRRESSPQTTRSGDRSTYNDRSNPRNEQYYSQYNNADRNGQNNAQRRQSEYNSGSSQQPPGNDESAGYNDRSNPRNERYYSRNDYEDYYDRPRPRSTNTSFRMVSAISCSSCQITFIA
jgi:hypothetical protein